MSQTENMNIPDKAVEAALDALPYQAADYVDTDTMRAALEAARPYIEKEAYERGWGAGFRHNRAATK